MSLNLVNAYSSASTYNGSDWYWTHPDGGIFSSARGCFVSPSDPVFLSWKAKGFEPQVWPTKGPGESEWQAMLGVLKPLRLDPESRVRARLDEFAWSGGYDDIISACSYKDSTDPNFSAEATRAIELRDQTWKVYIERQAELADDWPAMAALLPEAVW